MATKIRGITIEIGGDASGLNDALKSVNSNVRDTQSQLRDVNRLLKLDPKNTELLAQKQKLLSQQVENTKEKLEVLRKAEQDLKNSGVDENSAQFMALRREIIDTENSLSRLTRGAEKTETAFEKIGRAADNVGKKAGSVADATAGLSAAATGFLAAAVATVPATEELREDLSKLDQNAQENAVSIDAAREAWKDFAVQSGETDSAVEAVANLLQGGFTESNLQKAVEGLAGAAQRFPDTLKIESLADSLQETIATGNATGQFAELLDRVGVGAEAFNEGLQSCTTAAERQNYALETLAKAGLNDSYKAWKENNEELLENKEANLELQESMASLAEVVLPVVTTVTTAIARFIKGFAEMDAGGRNFIFVLAGIAAAISPVAKGIQLVSSALSFLAANPIALTIGAIVAVIAAVVMFGDEIQAVLQRVDDFLQGVFLTDWTQVFGPGLGDALNGFFATLKTIWDGVRNILNGIIDFIRGVFTGDWKRAWNGVKEIFSGVFRSLVGIAKAPINGIIALLNGAIGGLNKMIQGLNKIKFNVPSWVPGLGGKSFGVNIGTIGKIPYLANGGVLSQGSAIVGEAGPELLTMSGNRAIVQPLTQNTTTNHNLGGVSVTVYGAPGQDVRELAEIIMDEIQSATERRGAVFA